MTVQTLNPKPSQERAAALTGALEAGREVARLLEQRLLALRHDLVAQVPLPVKGPPRVALLPDLVPPLRRRRPCCGQRLLRLFRGLPTELSNYKLFKDVPMAWESLENP